MLQGLRLLDLADVNGLVKSFFRYKEQSNPCTHGHKYFRDATFIEAFINDATLLFYAVA